MAIKRVTLLRGGMPMRWEYGEAYYLPRASEHFNLFHPQTAPLRAPFYRRAARLEGRWPEVMKLDSSRGSIGT